MANELAKQRNGTGQWVATEDVAERDAQVLRLLAQGHSYKDIVDMHLPGIANRGCVSKARRRALDAIRAPAVAEYRAEMLAKLDALEAGAWQDVRNPGPKTSVTGKVVEDPATREPLPDNSVRDQARNTVLKTVRLRMDLLGLAAPRKSMSLQRRWSSTPRMRHCRRSWLRRTAMRWRGKNASSRTCGSSWLKRRPPALLR